LFVLPCRLSDARDRFGMRADRHHFRGRRFRGSSPARLSSPGSFLDDSSALAARHDSSRTALGVLCGTRLSSVSALPPQSLCEAIYRFAETHHIPVVHFKISTKARRKRNWLARIWKPPRTRQGPRRADRDRTGEGIGLAILAQKRTGEGPASAHGMGPRDGLYQPLLFLSLGYRVGRCVLED
jgi:hypothetical protein